MPLDSTIPGPCHEPLLTTVKIAQARTRGLTIRLRLELPPLSTKIPPSPPGPSRNTLIERFIGARESAPRRNATSPAQPHLVTLTINSPSGAILARRMSVIASAPATLTGPATVI